MISQLVDTELLYESYLNDVIVILLFIVNVRVIIAVGCFKAIGIKNGNSNLPIHDLLTRKAKQNVEYEN